VCIFYKDPYDPHFQLCIVCAYIFGLRYMIHCRFGNLKHIVCVLLTLCYLYVYVWNPRRCNYLISNIAERELAVSVNETLSDSESAPSLGTASTVVTAVTSSADSSGSSEDLRAASDLDSEDGNDVLLNQFLTTDSANIRIGFHNINSVRSKTDAFVKMIQQIKLSVICLCHSNCYMKAHVPYLPRYKSFYQLKPDLRGAGGIIIYVHENIMSSILCQPDLKENAGMLWVGLHLMQVKLAICCTYWRPTSGLAAEALRIRREEIEILATRVVAMSNVLKEQGWITVIGGDFNAKMGYTYPGFRQNLSPAVDFNGTILRDCIVNDNYRNFFNWNRSGPSATYFKQGPVVDRHAGNRGIYTCIDNVIWSEYVPVEMCHNTTVGGLMDIGSDHSWLLLKLSDIPYRTVPCREPKIWRLKAANWVDFSAVVSDILGSVITARGALPLNYTTTVEVITKAGMSAVGKSAFKPFTPIPDVETSRLQVELRRVKKFVAFLQRRLRAGDQNVNYITLRQNLRVSYRLRCLLRARKRLLSKESNKRFLCNSLSNNLKFANLFKLIKSEKRSHCNLELLRLPDGSMTSNSDIIAQQIRLYWSDIFTNTMPNYDIQKVREHYSLTNAFLPNSHAVMEARFTMSELEKALQQTNVKSAVGPSDLPPLFLTHLGTRMEEQLLLLFQGWWDSEYFPPEGQVARVSLLYKSGDPLLLASYRTLSLNCNLCKLYLRLITNRLTTVTEESSVLGEFQTGFRKNRRTTDNLLVLSTLVKKLKMDKADGYLAFLDIKKAYDRVDREVLFEKMRLMGVSLKLLANLRAIYLNPSATITWNRQKPAVHNLQMPVGLRQGCVLSPLLFLLYIADVVYNQTLLQSTVSLDFAANGHIYTRGIGCLLFADDLLLVAQNRRDLTRRLSQLGRDSLVSRIEFSSAKSQILPMKRPPRLQDPWEVTCNGRVVIAIKEYSEARYLGVQISRKGDLFSDQKRALVSKARKIMWGLWKIVSTTGNRQYYGSVVWGRFALPAILYGTEAMVLSAATLKQLQTIQNRFFRMCLGVQKRTSAAALSLYSGALPVKMEYEKRLLNYYRHAEALPLHRMVRQAMGQQRLWSYHDRNWFDRIRCILQYLDLWPHYRANTEYYVNLSKATLKHIFRRKYYGLMWADIAHNKALQFVQYRTARPEMCVSSDDLSLYWLKLKIGGLYFSNSPSMAPTICPKCMKGEDSWRHTMLYCRVIDTETNRRLPGWTNLMADTYRDTPLELEFLTAFFADREYTVDNIAAILFAGSAIYCRYTSRYKML